MRIDERVTAGERRNLGDEVTSAARGERPHMTQAISLAEGDRAAQDDEHAGCRFARREESLASRVGANRAKPPDAGDFALRELRKHLVLASRERVGCRDV